MRRNSDGSAGVGAQCHDAQTCGDSRARAARRSADDAIEVPGIPRSTVEGTVGCPAEHELMERRLAEDHRACLRQAANAVRVVLGDAPFVEWRADPAADARDVNVVLDQDGHPVQWQWRAGITCPLCPIGVRLRPVMGDLDDAVQILASLDPFHEQGNCVRDRDVPPGSAIIDVRRNRNGHWLAFECNAAMTSATGMTSAYLASMSNRLAR